MEKPLKMCKPCSWQSIVLCWEIIYSSQSKTLINKVQGEIDMNRGLDLGLLLTFVFLSSGGRLSEVNPFVQAAALQERPSRDDLWMLTGQGGESAMGKP